MKILVTGAAGFIGAHLCRSLLSSRPHDIIVGLDNLNDYYDVNLKVSRLRWLDHPNFHFIKGDICDRELLSRIFEQGIDIVVHLAAQAGVRYSITNPDVYIQTNLIGFFNMLEQARSHHLKHFIFASSSSVYGANKDPVFSTRDKTDRPVSLYAATKKSDELLAYSYAKLYGIPMTGLRFFTAYGPAGRPDMAYYKFTEAMARKQKIPVFNYGDLYRDFTYIDDIVNGVSLILDSIPEKDEAGANYVIYNIGNNNPVQLLAFIKTLEAALLTEGIISEKAQLELLPMQDGDVYYTCADIGPLQDKYGFEPRVSLAQGLSEFAKWYKNFRG